MARHHAIFVSDLHIGSRQSRLDRLVALLNTHQAHTLYLVGDVFDGHTDPDSDWSIVKEFVDRLFSGSFADRVFIIPGNHDPLLMKYLGRLGPNIYVVPDCIHVCLNGMRYVVTHGDQFDFIASHLPGVARLISNIDHSLRWILDKTLGRYKESLLSSRINGWINKLLMTETFYQQLAMYVVNKRAEGIIYGHFHEPKIHEHKGVSIINCGDWVDHLSAVVEDEYGIRIINWW